jgi:LacI family transcriptional regulator
VRAGVPVVNIGGALRRPGIPRVTVANREIGHWAADHLFKCGFRRFAFYGLRGVAFSQDRQTGFAARLEELGFPCAAHLSPNTYGLRRLWQDDLAALQRWLEQLCSPPRPVGIFAVNDFRARLVIDACDLAQLKVPAQIGVVGVDNDKMMCEFSKPTLSSIECNWHRVGFEAARGLHALLEGKTPEPEMRISPLEVVGRASTAVTLTEDPRLLKAVTYIRDHLGEIFGVERLLEISDVSRRKLEQIFNAEMRMSPYQYLCQKRIERAKMMLRSDSTLNLKQISRMCGFRDSRRFRLVFARMEGLTPARYRNVWRQRPVSEAQPGGTAAEA